LIASTKNPDTLSEVKRKQNERETKKRKKVMKKTKQMPKSFNITFFNEVSI
jgi:hypothetical protein